MRLLIGSLASAVAAGSLAAQGAPAREAPLSDHLRYLLAQTSSGFEALRADSLGGGSWRHRYRISAQLDSTGAMGASTITTLDRPQAGGKAGKAIVATFPLARSLPDSQTAMVTGFREQIAAALPTWQNRSTDGGDWTECADPYRGREVVLSSTRTAGGEMLLLLSITVHPDPTCA
jgi:hypothetical protein